MASIEEQKKEIRLVQWQADTAIRDAFLDVAPHVADAVVAAATKDPVTGTPVITPQGRVEALQAIDHVLDSLFGERRGSRSLIADIVAEHTAKARKRVFHRAATEMLDAMPDELQVAVKKGLPDGKPAPEAP